MRGQLLPRHADILRLMESRRSVRRFLPRPVPQEVIEQVLQAATWAPSAHNRQPWRFTVLRSTESKTNLAVAMGAEFKDDLLKDGVSAEDAQSQVERSRRRIEEAPVAILLCMDLDEVDEYPDTERQKAAYRMAAQSVALAGGYLLLAAHALDLGGVWMCAPLFAPLVVSQALALPLQWQPEAIVLLGYPAKIPETRPRKALAEICRFL
ncbi:MAG: hypothetical protein A2W33_03730 [Chloroflexi bacterium RBG_16_52_11]|nr:MAG: hypothetical protein A2W33_03730 [Chloroflexi bacterium RBG_16_52_11]